MNADILKRVVRAIADGSQDDLQRLADKIIETERRTGHKRLADQLEAILKQPRIVGNGHRPTGDVNRKLSELPLSRRHGESLAALVPTEALEHHMVLQAETEERFARIEREYAARTRLGGYGLRPRKTILLYGPPGCGKSLGAKRLAWNTGLPLMKIRFDVLISSYLVNRLAISGRYSLQRKSCRAFCCSMNVISSRVPGTTRGTLVRRPA
jgi:SpoVK/Ycf46/Vps4 family AAA+-type ATPase